MTAARPGREPGREAARNVSRRAVLRGGAGLLAAGGASALLAACSGGGTGSDGNGEVLNVASPANPVLQPIASDNKPIAIGQRVERGSTLTLFNYADYIDPDALTSFQRTYGVKVQVQTFDTSDGALDAIKAGKAPYDIYFPSYDQISKLASGGFLQPLTHGYIPNIRNVWPEFSNPFYDQQWRYSVPYTVYNTGIAWRTDMIPEDISLRPNPFDVFWDDKYQNKLTVLDDYRTAMGMVLLRNNLNLNTSRQADLDLVNTQLTDMARLTHPKALTTDYTDLPEGKYPLVQAWSGDVVNALNSLPAGVDPAILRYWTPSDSRNQSDNDLMVILRGTKSPVAAHLFLNHMLDYQTAVKNFTAIGYQAPQRRITPETLVNDGLLTPTLSNATVRPEYFITGQRILELQPAVDQRWKQVWNQFKARA